MPTPVLSCLTCLVLILPSSCYRCCRNNLLIGEDTSKHLNNALWAWNFRTGEGVGHPWGYFGGVGLFNYTKGPLLPISWRSKQPLCVALSFSPSLSLWVVGELVWEGASSCCDLQLVRMALLHCKATAMCVNLNMRAASGRVRCHSPPHRFIAVLADSTDAF
jgi:hypothetical protein